MKILKYILVVIVAVALLLLVTGNRVLIWEHKVSPGESYVVTGQGDVGSAKQATLVCYYFTGRNVLATQYWYSSNNILGRDSCPFLLGQ